MTTKSRRVALVVLMSSGCASAVPPAVVRVEPRELSESAVITVVEVPPPWYAIRPLLVRAFRKAIPQYQALDGLERKAFTIAADGDFGGVYLWRDRARAESWFGAAWHARVRQKYGVDGKVRMFAVEHNLDGPSLPVEQGPMVVTIDALADNAQPSLDRYRGVDGLRSATLARDSTGRPVVIASWLSKAAAHGFIADGVAVEWFDAPLAIVNASAD